MCRGPACISKMYENNETIFSQNNDGSHPKMCSERKAEAEESKQNIKRMNQNKMHNTSGHFFLSLKWEIGASGGGNFFFLSLFAPLCASDVCKWILALGLLESDKKNCCDYKVKIISIRPHLAVHVKKRLYCYCQWGLATSHSPLGSVSWCLVARHFQILFAWFWTDQDLGESVSFLSLLCWKWSPFSQFWASRKTS